MSKNNAVQPKGDTEGGQLSYVPAIYKIILGVLAASTAGLLVGVIVLATTSTATATVAVSSGGTTGGTTGGTDGGTTVVTDGGTTVGGTAPVVAKPREGINPCVDKKPIEGFENKDCEDALEQSGSNVTVGYKGDFNTTASPINVSYYEAGLCPVNVHWHLGAEHLSVGEYDEHGIGPVPAEDDSGSNHRRRAATTVRGGFRCMQYSSTTEKFTKPYDWKHCIGMVVGETYEVHWPHSKGGACGTPNQYQTPFYDGVFCDMARIAPTTHQSIGVQAQIFTIVNDEDYYYPDLFRGMIVDGQYGSDIAYYTGSTTGTTRNNEICSAYAPITWQVDRKCHQISASSFDKMCQDMKSQRDDMSADLHAHGARELVDDAFVANNHQRR